MNNPILIYQVQAFTDGKLGGSPTGVILQADRVNESQMQWIATTLNASHTAFVTAAEGQDCDINIRFFTPGGEIKNCGHATIATHFLLAMKQGTSQDYAARQKTQTGIQDVQICYQAGSISVMFEQNEIILSDVENDIVQELLALFDLSSSDLLEQYPIRLASPGANRFLLPLKSQETLAELKPTFPAMRTLCKRTKSIGCFAFTLNGSDNKWEAWGRMFAPMIGVNEDIVNGNSSGCLGAYLMRLPATGHDDNALTLTVFQGHGFGLPGKVTVKAIKNGGQIKTFVGGTAMVTGETTLDIK